jgi:sarcosine oxidase subunit beta
MTTKVYDAIIIGAGSVGGPAAFFLAQAGLKPLVIDQFASPGQGSNKAAIGGIRATHSAPSKIRLCIKSIEVFSTWEETYGDNIEWYQGGYSFVAYRERDERVLKDLLKIQQSYGLDIHWLSRDDLLEVIPDLNREGLIGGTYSPGDGSASPLRTAHAFYIRAKERGAEFRFRERVTGVIRRRGRVVGVRTDKGGYATGTVINAAGPWARASAQMAGLDVPVVPDSHEAGITEPVARFLEPMVVDIRPAGGSKNYYRRTWRGLYPMTPDGFPIVGRARELEGYIYAVGMCGQGYMLGPGMGALLARLVQDDLMPEDEEVLKELSPYREFGGEEKLK